MLGRAQKPNRTRSLCITLPSVMPLVAHPVRQRERQNQPDRTLGNALIFPVGTMPPMSFVHPAYGTRPTFYMPPSSLIQRHDDMLSSLLGQYILDYEPPRGFAIPAFATFNGSTDPYDHMLHYNQAMILNVGNDRLLCKVFPIGLRGFTLPWFHKLPCNLINSFNELWVAFILQYLCSVRQKRNISPLQTILKQEGEPIRDFTQRFGQVVQQVESCSMDAVLQKFRRSF